MDGKKSIQELTVAFDRALVAAGYSESRLTNFRTVIKRLLIFGAAQGIECYSSSVGKKFLEKCYPVEFDGRLVHELPCTTQYAWRTITLLNDFNTHGAFFRARRLRGNLQLTTEFQNLSDEFGDDCRGKGTSEATVYRRQADLRKFFNYLHSNKIAISEISHKTVIGFLGTIITLSDDAVEHHRRTVSLFLQFLFHNGYVSEDYSRNIPAKRSLRKNPLPSVWEHEDVDQLLSAVDRANPMGKRDYAILLLVTKLGLRVGDIRALCLGDIDWENSRLSFIQSKTQKRVDLPLPDDVGWAIIDYLKYGRPKTTIDAYVDRDIRRVQSSFVPYIFSHSEIVRLFAAADGLPYTPISPQRVYVMSLLFRMLYGCGLRISEALNLVMADVDLDQGILYIRNSKFGKERLVPMSESLTFRCFQYVSNVGKHRKDEAAFFQTPCGGHYASGTILYAWRQTLYCAGISYGGKGKGPRIHDLRHTFAVHCLQKWVEAGEDLNAKLPYLSAYMGHAGLYSTQQYLRLTAEAFPHIVSAMEHNFDVFPGRQVEL